MSPRPRSANPHIPKSISLPTSMWLEIDEQLGPMGSKSAWIAAAVKQKLEGSTFTVAEATAKQLLTALFNRGLFAKSMYDTLVFQIEAKKLD